MGKPAIKVRLMTHQLSISHNHNRHFLMFFSEKMEVWGLEEVHPKEDLFTFPRSGWIVEICQNGQSWEHWSYLPVYHSTISSTNASDCHSIRIAQGNFTILGHFCWFSWRLWFDKKDHLFIWTFSRKKSGNWEKSNSIAMKTDHYVVICDLIHLQHFTSKYFLFANLHLPISQELTRSFFEFEMTAIYSSIKFVTDMMYRH